VVLKRAGFDTRWCQHDWPTSTQSGLASRSHRCPDCSVSIHAADSKPIACLATRETSNR
jgi:hypothetical protein